MEATQERKEALTLDEVKARAIAAYEATRAREQAQHEKYERERNERNVESLREAIARVLGITVPVEDIFPQPSNFAYGPDAITEIDGWTVHQGTDARGGLVFNRPCHDCDGEIYGGTVRKLEDYGELLAGHTQQRHEHYFAEDSTHPNAPKPEPAPAFVAPVTHRSVPIADALFLDQLRSWVYLTAQDYYGAGSDE